MKKLLLAGVAMIALGSVSAQAADIQRRQCRPRRRAYLPPPPYNWTGFYVGINGGGGWGRSDFSTPFSTGSFKTSGGLVGGTLGTIGRWDKQCLVSRVTWTGATFAAARSVAAA